MPCCEAGIKDPSTGHLICTGRLFTDWRPDYQKYMCNRCMELTPSPISRIIAQQNWAKKRREARRGEFSGVEDAADFWPSNIAHGYEQ